MTQTDLIGWPDRVQVRQHMTADPQTLEVTQSLLDAALLLRRSHLRHIPIVENGHLVGILTDKDVARYAPSRLTPLPEEEYNRVFEGTALGKVMTKEPVTTTPDSPLGEAVVLLYTKRLGCLPVLEEGKLVGIITVTDMLRALQDFIGAISSPPGSPQKS